LRAIFDYIKAKNVDIAVATPRLFNAEIFKKSRKLFCSLSGHSTSFVDPLLDTYGLYHKHPTTGKNIIKYTSGVALMLSPFFIIAHYMANLLGLTADGFSTIYKLFLGLGAIFWVSLGLWCLFTVLEKYFTQFVTVITIVAIS